MINLDSNNINGKIISLSKKEYYQKITIKYSIYKINVYDYDFLDLKIGQVIKVNGEIKEIEANHIPNAFNYQKYISNNLYLCEIKANEIRIMKKSFSVNIFNYYINKYLETYFSDESLIILKAFIIGDTSSFNTSFKEAIKTNGIVHLFALSGLHISLFISLLEKILKNIKKKNIIINIFLFVYLIITKFGVSISRAIITYYLKLIFLKLNLKFTSLDRTSIVFILFSIINPYLMYNNGFVLSFFATFIILLINDKLKNIKEIKSILIISFYTTLLTFPIIININNEINILSPIINIIMIILVEVLILPLSIIVCLFPILNYIYLYIVKAFIYIIELLSNLSYSLNLVIIIKHLDFFMIIIYYLIVLFILTFNLKKYKKMAIIFYIIFLLIISINISFSPIITFLDLYKGEATLIEYKDEKILIDTGEGINNEVTSFLKSKGIRKIDYLFITHNHSDHNGEYESIKKSIKIKNVIKNTFDDRIYQENDKKVETGDVIDTKYLKFEVLNPTTSSSNINNTSLVLFVYIDGVSFLFLGDVESEVDKSIIINKKVDVIKVAHHGSKTATSIEFLNNVKPKYAIIMNGRSDMFSFPHEEVLLRLKEKNVKTYITKENYTIIVKIKNRKLLFYPTK